MDSNPTISTDENTQPTHKRARQSPKSKLEQFIAEALQIEKEKMAARTRGFAPMPPQAWPASPYWDYGTVGSAVSKELGGLEKSTLEIEWRLKHGISSTALVSALRAS
jgi:hypothetical protein